LRTVALSHLSVVGVSAACEHATRSRVNGRTVCGY